MPTTPITEPIGGSRDSDPFLVVSHRLPHLAHLPGACCDLRQSTVPATPTEPQEAEEAVSDLDHYENAERELRNGRAAEAVAHAILALADEVAEMRRPRSSWIIAHPAPASIEPKP